MKPEINADLKNNQSPEEVDKKIMNDDFQRQVIDNSSEAKAERATPSFDVLSMLSPFVCSIFFAVCSELMRGYGDSSLQILFFVLLGFWVGCGVGFVLSIVSLFLGKAVNHPVLFFVSIIVQFFIFGYGARLGFGAIYIITHDLMKNVH